MIRFFFTFIVFLYGRLGLSLTTFLKLLTPKERLKKCAFTLNEDSTSEYEDLVSLRLDMAEIKAKVVVEWISLAV
jgi:hypothetical protein